MSKPKKRIRKAEPQKSVIYRYESRRLIPLGDNSYAEVFDEIVDPETEKRSAAPSQGKAAHVHRQSLSNP